jgi:hypothetical protein
MSRHALPVPVLDWRRLADQHRPADPRPEFRRLAASGLTPRDIAQATRTPIGDVLEALRADDRA